VTMPVLPWTGVIPTAVHAVTVVLIVTQRTLAMSQEP
jgi:hypothetical protein